MLQGLNVEEIKKYNESLRQQKEIASKLMAEIEFNTVELNRMCKEISAEIGREVTVENIREIYAERVAKINNTLQTGKEILRRVAEEEASASEVKPSVMEPMDTNDVVFNTPIKPEGAVFNQALNQGGLFADIDGGKPSTMPFDSGSIQI